nr:hypothetical protein OHA15_33655 [Streptomyces anthocyanicus]
MTDQTTAAEPREPDNPAAWALAQHIADHPMSTVQAAFRYLNAPLAVELHKQPADEARTRLLQALDATYCQALGFSPEGLLAAYEASRTQTVDQAVLRDRLDAAIDDVFTRWQTGLGGQRPQDAIRDAVLAAVLREAAETGRGCPPDCPCRAVCIGTLKPAVGARQDGAQ